MAFRAAGCWPHGRLRRSLLASSLATNAFEGRLDPALCTMHNACVATKTISLRLDAYEKLRAARREPTESFTQVILRARWPEETVTAGELLRRYRERGGFLSEEDLDRIDELKARDAPPPDKWNDS